MHRELDHNHITHPLPMILCLPVDYQLLPFQILSNIYVDPSWPCVYSTHLYCIGNRGKSGELSTSGISAVQFTVFSTPLY